MAAAMAGSIFRWEGLIGVAIVMALPVTLRLDPDPGSTTVGPMPRVEPRLSGLAHLGGDEGANGRGGRLFMAVEIYPRRVQGLTRELITVGVVRVVGAVVETTSERSRLARDQ